MSMPLSLARRITSGRVTLDDLREEAERTLGSKKAQRKRTAPKRAAGREAKALRRAEESAEMSAAREAVWAWNKAHNREEAGWGTRAACDCGCRRQFWGDDQGQFDHWIERSQGGPDTRENGWRLHHDCHDQKTNSRPSRQEWNRRRFAYCLRAGVPFVERRVKVQFRPPSPASPQETT